MTLAPGFSHAVSLFAVAAPALADACAARGERPGASDVRRSSGAAGGLAALVREQDALFLAVPASCCWPLDGGAHAATGRGRAARGWR